MALPLRYAARNLIVRRAAALLTALGIALTVAVFAGVLALRAGFEQVYRARGRGDLAVYLRPGATSEGESGLRREQAEILIKERPEILKDQAGRPLAAKETFLAVYMELLTGGVTNVPIRGIEPASLTLHADDLKLAQGRWLNFGSDEIVVGRPLTTRMRGCQVGDTLTVNVTPFTVVGVFDHAGAHAGEIWGDVERMLTALQRPIFQRVIAHVAPGTDLPELSKALEQDRRVPLQVLSERDCLSKQTSVLGGVLAFLAGFLTLIMGIAAVLGAMNTMLASVAARTHEIGVLLAIGFSRAAVFAAFLLESGLMGLVGGALGVVFILPFDGVQTGAMNWNTFTDVSFAFQVTPALAAQAVILSFVLGLVGGALPALHAARLRPVEALRQGLE